MRTPLKKLGYQNSEPMQDANIIAGIHAVRLALDQGAEQVQTVWYDLSRKDQRIAEILEQAANLRLPVHGIERLDLDNLTNNAKHQGVAAQISMPKAWSETALYELIARLTEPAFLLILDGVQDPHNLGACLRTSEAAGIHAIIAPKDRSVGITPSVCKVASGAAGRVPYVQVTNLARTLKALKELDIALVGTTEDALTPLYNANLCGPLALLLGGEHKGLRRLTREHCDTLIRLPMRGAVESLNVSVATGIFLYEALRQRSIAVPL